MCVGAGTHAGTKSYYESAAGCVGALGCARVSAGVGWAHGTKSYKILGAKSSVPGGVH